MSSRTGHNRWPIILVLPLLLLTAVILLSRGAPAAANSDTVVVKMTPAAWAIAAAALQPVHALDYGAFVWLELPAGEIAHLNAAGLDYELQPNPFTLTLAEQQFDPLHSAPQLAAGWDKIESGGPDFHLVQLVGPTRPEWLADLQQKNLRIVQYIHPHTYVVWGENSSAKTQNADYVRWTGPFVNAYRVLPQWQKLAAVPVQANILFYRGANIDAAVRQLEQMGGRNNGRSLLNDTWEIAGFTLDGSRFQAAAQISGVYTIQPVPLDGGLRGEMSNQINVNNHDAGNVAFPGYFAWLASVGLDGNGVIMANVDSGIQSNHPDLVNRLLPCTGSTCSTVSSSHGTHTAAIMAGDASSGIKDSYGFYRGLGVAPGANLIEQVYSSYNQPGGMLRLMTQSYQNGALLSGNSWGPSGSALGYDSHTLQVDIGVRDADPDAPGNQEFSYVLSIMNGNGGTSSQGTPDDAKNIFTIGSTKMQTSSGVQILDINDISDNSAHGPARDGRKIPHMVAPGCRVDSATTGSGYTLLCGTSMASPHVSGAVGLFIEYYRNLLATNPSPAMVKAAFLPVAHSLAGFRDADNGILGHPFDSKQGWGRMDLDAVVNPQVEVHYFDNPTLFTATGQEWTQSIYAVDPSQPLRVMLVWTDAPGHGLGGATPAWNNNLDLVVEYGGNSYRGNQFDAAGWSQTGGSADDRNNTEGVFIGPTAQGSALIRVIAAHISSDGVPGNGYDTDQDFALVCYNCTTLQSPSELHVLVQNSDAAPISGATVIASDGTITNTYSATTDIAGTAVLNVESGDYDVTASAFGYLSNTAVVTTNPDTPTAITLTLATAPLFTLEGTVSDETTGAPLRHIILDFFNAPLTAQTDDNGHYELVVPQGTYIISFVSPLHGHFAVEIEVDDDTTLDIILTATTSDGLLKGVVYNGNTNQPVAGATVTIAGGSTAVSDDNGYYQIQNAAGSHTVEATAPLYGTAVVESVVIDQSNQTRLDLYLPAAALAVTSGPIMAYVGLEQTTSLPFQIGNEGDHPLTFEIQERNGGFTPMSASRAPSILLVNDSNNGPNLPFYQNALNALGYSYTLFTVSGSGNGPTAAVMSDYDLVIWFSGAAFGGSSSPIAGPNAFDEGQLATYLDNGGKLLLSSQDYYWDHGQTVTSFMSTYLGVATMLNDTSLASVTGANAFAGLGPYNLSHSGTDYSDRITPNSSGQAAFVDSISRAGGVYSENSIFLGFMWESIQNNNPANGQASLQAMIDYLSPPEIPWLTIEPASGVVDGQSTLPVMLGFTAESPLITEPGLYTGTLRLHSNDPDRQQVELIVAMHVLSDTFEAFVYKEASATVVWPGDVITYTISRQLLADASHQFDETIFDAIPEGLTLLTDTIEFNGEPAVYFYDPEQNALSHSWGDSFENSHWYTLTYQAQVNSDVISGTLLNNSYDSWIGLNGGLQIGPHTAEAMVTVEEPITFAADLWFTANVDTVMAGDVFTYTISRQLQVAGSHNYSETLLSSLPAGLIVLTDTILFDGAARPELYDAEAHAIRHAWMGTATASDWYTLTFQVQVAEDATAGWLTAQAESWIEVEGAAAGQYMLAETAVEAVPPPVYILYLPVIGKP